MINKWARLHKLVTLYKLAACVLFLLITPLTLFTPLVWGMAAQLQIPAISAIKERIPHVAQIAEWIQKNKFELVFNFLRDVDVEAQKTLYTTPLYKIKFGQNIWPKYKIYDPTAFQTPELLRFTAVQFAAYHDNVAALQFFNELGIPLTQSSRDIAPPELPYGSVPTITFTTPLNIAAHSGSIEAIKYLFSIGVDLFGSPCALDYAAGGGQIAAIECLIILADRVFDKAFLYAVKHGGLAAAQYLAKRGSSTFTRTDEGFTALHLAILTPPHTAEDRIQLIEWLASIDLPLDAQDEKRRTALHLAVEEGYTTYIACLHRLGAYLEARDKNGNTPLHIAAKEDQEEAIELLCKLKANIEASNFEGYTPLHLAVARIKPESWLGLSCLLKNGANPEARNDENETALTLAVKKNSLNAIALLWLHGVNLQALDVTEISREETRECIQLLLAVDQFKKKQKQLQNELDEHTVFFVHRLVKQLLCKKTFADASGLLKKAIELNIPCLVEYLLPYYPAINAQCEDGNTILHTAAATGNQFLIHILCLDPAIDYSIKNKQNKTALECMVTPFGHPNLSLNGRFLKNELERAIKIRAYLWLLKADVTNQQGQKIKLPRDVAQLIARMVTC